MLSSLSFTSLSIASFTFGSGGGGGGGGLSFLNLSAAVKKFLNAFSIAAFCAAVGCTSFCKISLVLFNRSSIVGGLGGGGGSCAFAKMAGKRSPAMISIFFMVLYYRWIRVKNSFGGN